MISRYSTDEMNSIWSEESYFKNLDYFIYSYLNTILNRKVLLIKTKPNIPRIREIESSTKHEFASVLIHFEERIDPTDQEAKKFLNSKLTSSDALDTVFTYQCVSSVAYIKIEIDNLIKTLNDKILSIKNLPAMGRTHGRHAETILFKNRFEHLKQELLYSLELFYQFQNTIYPKLNGPTGSLVTPNNVNESMTNFYSNIITFSNKNFTTQVVPRHLYSILIFASSIVSAAIDRFSQNMRILSIDEINEVQESFSQGQIGSSSMPHKVNPISFENFSGIHRLIKSNLNPSIENISLWFERDMSHSSVERVIYPDNFHLVHYLLKRFSSVIKRLNINTDVIQNNLLNSTSKNSVVEFNQLCESMNRFEAYNAIQNEYLNNKKMKF